MRTCLKPIMAAVILVAAALPLAAQAPTPPAPLVKPEAVRQVSAHVHMIPDDSVPLVPNVGFAVGSRAVLVIDTGLGPRNSAAVAAVAQRLAGKRALYLVTTHVHPEHDLGAQALPTTTTSTSTPSCFSSDSSARRSSSGRPPWVSRMQPKRASLIAAVSRRGSPRGGRLR